MSTAEDFNLYDDEHEPKVCEYAKVYWLKIDDKKTGRENFTNVFITVDPYDMINLDSGQFLGESIDTTNHKRCLEIYGWLVEWEYAEWKKIGPEDSELFASDKLKECKPYIVSPYD